MKHVFLLCLVSLMTFSSCSKDDGDWDPMKWETSVKVGKDDKVDVPAEGATYTFKCKNYDGIWLAKVEENGKFMEIEKFNVCQGDWYTVKTSGATLTVEVSANETSESRQMTVHPTAGDIFDSYTFVQSGK